MKKYFLLFLLSIFAISCSKKVEVKGKITGGSPMERVELIDASGVTTLPLINIGVTPTGDFSGSFDAPKNGMYVVSYAGKIGFVYLKKGQSVNISGNAQTFPQDLVITGDAKNNNDFIKASQKSFEQYTSKINVMQDMQKDEAGFLKSAQKIYTDLEKILDDSAKKVGADSEVLQLKKDELATNILSYMSQYEANHGMAINNPSFKVSKAFTDYQAKLSENGERMVENLPAYRNFLLNKISPEFQKFAQNFPQEQGFLTSDILAKFLKTKKDISDKTKDYLLAFVASHDVKLGDYAAAEKVNKIAEENIKNESIKKDLKTVTAVIGGMKEGSVLPEASLVKADGKSANLNELKGKPTMVMFYASWNPFINQSVVPVLKEVVNFYKSKMNFAYVNFDDTKEQFVKTSNAMLKGIDGKSFYADGGLKSDFAQKLNIYGFKLPGFIVLDKDGKVVGKYFSELGNEDFVNAMDKVSGLKAPRVQAPDPNVQLQVGADAVKAQQQAQQQQQAPQQPQPAK